MDVKNTKIEWILCPVCGNKTRGADTGGYRAKELPAILP